MKHNHSAFPRMWSRAAHMRQGIFHFAVLSLLLLLVSTGFVAMAQERFGEINGTAMDASGAVLPDVKVTVANKATGRSIETITGGSGFYTAPHLESGHYSVRFELK